MTKYTLEQCLEQQKKVDAGIDNTGTYWPWLEANGELIEFCQHMQLMGSWKKQPPKDVKQAFMECVDYLAFKMSGAVADGFESINKSAYDDWRAACKPLCLEELLQNLFKQNTKYAFIPSVVIIELIAEYVANKNLSDLCYYYMGKQTLTRFRQDNGYKDGSYIKIWGEREDNEFLTDALEQGIEIEAVYEHLKTNYERIVIAKAEVE